MHAGVEPPKLRLLTAFPRGPPRAALAAVTNRGQTADFNVRVDAEVRRAALSPRAALRQDLGNRAPHSLARRELPAAALQRHTSAHATGAFPGIRCPVTSGLP